MAEPTAYNLLAEALSEILGPIVKEAVQEASKGGRKRSYPTHPRRAARENRPGSEDRTGFEGKCGVAP